MWWIIGGIVIFCGVAVYASCVVASRADDAAEAALRKMNKEN